MSWEGFTQAICLDGHYRTYGDGTAYYDVPILCDCGKRWQEKNIVDETNGCDGSPCQCGYKEQVVVTPAVVEECNLGHVHVIKEEKVKFGKVHTYETSCRIKRK